MVVAAKQHLTRASLCDLAWDPPATWHTIFADAKQAAYDELFEILSSGGEPGVEQ